MSLQHPTRPGQRCRIIDSVVGPEGQSVGKECVTLYLHEDTLRLNRYDGHGKPFVEDLGPLWRVRGSDLHTEYSVGDEIDCAGVWLEVIDEPTNAAPRHVARDLALHP